MPKKIKEEPEWVEDEVTPAVGKTALMFTEKLASC